MEDNDSTLLAAGHDNIIVNIDNRNGIFNFNINTKTLEKIKKEILLFLRIIKKPDDKFQLL